MAIPASNPRNVDSASRRHLPGAVALARLAGPIGRVGRYYARAWRDYLDQKPGEFPIARPTAALAAHALRDEVVLLGLRLNRPVSNLQAFQRIADEVNAARDYYQRRGFLDKPEGFFDEPPPLTDVTVREAKGRGGRHKRMYFDSGYVAHRGEPGRERWLGYTSNAREYVLMLRHSQPRPWLVCIHGAEMGRPAFDLTVWLPVSKTTSRVRSWACRWPTSWKFSTAMPA